MSYNKAKDVPHTQGVSLSVESHNTLVVKTFSFTEPQTFQRI